MEKTNLTVIRHGESLLNKAMANSPSFFCDAKTRDFFRNKPDHKVSLTRRGKNQALRTGECLGNKGLRYSVAIHTGYARTKETLNQVLKNVDADKIEENIAFRERENGYAYVMTKDELSKNFTWNERYWETFGPVFARPIGGESLLDVYHRVKPALSEILSEYRGENIMLVTHGRVIGIIRLILEKWSIGEFESFLKNKNHTPKNCGVTMYSFDKNLVPSLLYYNKTYW